jgi:NAD(P)-dependent dehydrogenase (short-subunit alcohol dehydrogenase family)
MSIGALRWVAAGGSGWVMTPDSSRLLSRAMGLMDGKVAIVTGAGRGIGRGEALLLAREGAAVVVNELDAEVGKSVVEEVRAAGGQAALNNDDCSDYAGAERLVQQAVDEFGALDALVNNAGIVRDRTLVKMSEQEWDAVI